MRLSNNSGIILVVVLWLLVILSMMTIGISQRTRIELSLTKHTIGKIKSKYIAWGGIVYALDIIRKDSTHEESSSYDNSYELGVSLEDDDPEDLFAGVEIEDGTFDIIRPAWQRNHETFGGDPPIAQYGFSDEESKLNLNTLPAEQYTMIRHLLTHLGVDFNTAEEIAAAVMDWRDTDDELWKDPYGAENDYYASQGFSCKNGVLESVEELLLIKGVTPEIFEKVRPYVTVFPKGGKFQVNLNTAAYPVILALATDYVGAKTNTDVSDAESLARKLNESRNGSDGIEGTSDDRVITDGDRPLNAKERAIFFSVMQHHAPVSRFLHVLVEAVENRFRVRTRIEAIIDRQNLNLVYWKRI